MNRTRRRPLALSCALAAAGLFLAGHLAAYSLFSPDRTWSCPPDYTVDNAGLPSPTTDRPASTGGASLPTAVPGRTTSG